MEEAAVNIYILAGLAYAFAGFLDAGRTGSATNLLGDGYELDAIAACVVGGVSMRGGIGKISGIVIEILKSKGILQDTKQSSSRTLVVNKQMRDMIDTSRHSECVRHICLKTEEGTSIILNCLSKQGNITFDGAVYIQGTHDFTSNIVSCRELSEPD